MRIRKLISTMALGLTLTMGATAAHASAGTGGSGTGPIYPHPISFAPVISEQAGNCEMTVKGSFFPAGDSVAVFLFDESLGGYTIQHATADGNGAFTVYFGTYHNGPNFTVVAEDLNTSYVTNWISDLVFCIT